MVTYIKNAKSRKYIFYAVKISKDFQILKPGFNYFVPSGLLKNVKFSTT